MNGKEFVKWVLAVVCGLFVWGIVKSVMFFMMFASMLASASLSGGSDAVIPKEGVLIMDMSKLAIIEQTQENNPLASIQNKDITPLGIRDAVSAIHKAAEDPGVKYILIKADGAATSLTKLEEIRKALTDYRKSGKAVVAYGEAFTSGSYYLASVADKIYTTSHHGGNTFMLGISGRMLFLKDLLDKLGVSYQLIRHGKYKSAGETYIKNAPSPENMEQNQEMINSIWTNLAEVICESRDITREKLDSLIDNLCLCTPQDFLKYSLVDELLTKEELKEKLAALAVKDSFKEVQMIPFKDYVTVLTTTPSAAKNKIAIIFAEGEIVDGKDKQAVAGDRFASIIADVRADSSVKAVVLRVASPGGSVLASEKIRSEIDLLRKEKPVIASYGSYAASGGYWISNSCDKIYSDPSTLTGSIGVFSMIPDFSKTAKDILKVNVISVGSSRHSDMFSLIRPLDAQEVAYMQKSVNDIYDAFLANVSEGRGMSTEEIDKIAQGRVWTGADALKIGLVDEIGSLYDAVSYAAGTQGDGDLADWSITCYPKPQTLLEMIMESLSGTSSVMAGTPFAPVEKAYKDWNWNSSERIYARMPYIMEIK